MEKGKAMKDLGKAMKDLLDEHAPGILLAILLAILFLTYFEYQTSSRIEQIAEALTPQNKLAEKNASLSTMSTEKAAAPSNSNAPNFGTSVNEIRELSKEIKQLLEQILQKITSFDEAKLATKMVEAMEKKSHDQFQEKVERSLEGRIAEKWGSGNAAAISKQVQSALQGIDLGPDAMHAIDEWIEAGEPSAKNAEKANAARPYIFNILKRAVDLANLVGRIDVGQLVDHVMSSPKPLTRFGWLVKKGLAMGKDWLKKLPGEVAEQAAIKWMLGDEHKNLEKALGEMWKEDIKELREELGTLASKIGYCRTCREIEKSEFPSSPCPRCAEPLVLHYGPDQVHSSEQKQIEMFAQHAYEDPTKLVLIRAHTDTTGTRRHNTKLAKDRANSVYRALVRPHKELAPRITTAAFGEDRLRVPTSDNKEAEENRVVVLTLEVP